MELKLKDDLLKKISKLGYSSEQHLDQKSLDLLLESMKKIEVEIESIDDDSEKAILFYEMGLIWNEQLHNARKAIISFQKSYDADSNYLLNLQTVRNIFVQKKNWNLALDILDIEIEFTDDDEARLFLEILKLDIIFEKNNNFGALQKEIQVITENYELNIFALTKIRFFYIEKNKFQDYLRLLEKIVLNTTKFCRYFILLDMITIYYKYNLKLELSINIYTNALFDSNADFLFVIPDLNWKSFAHYLKKNQDPKRIYQLYKVYKSKLKDNSEANKLLISSYPYIKDDYLGLEELEEHYGKSYNWEKYIDIQGKKIKLLEDPEEKSNVYYQVGHIYLNEMKNGDRAKIAFETAVKFNKHNMSAIRALSKIAYKKKDKKSLIKYHLMESKNITNPDLKAVMFFRIAEIFRTERAYEFAETYYLKSLEFDKNYWPSFDSLLTIYKKSKQWGKYISILKGEISNTENVEKQNKLKYKIGTIYIEYLNDFKSAKSYLESIPEYDYEGTLNSHLSYIYEQESDWESLITFYNKRLREISDSQEKIKLLFSIAKLYIKELNNTEQGIKFLKKILRITPNYLPVIKELGILLRKNEKWEELIELNLDEIKLIESKYKRSVRFIEIAEIYEKQLKDTEKSLKYYEQAFKEDNKNFQAIAALKYLYINLKKKEELVNFLKNRINSISSNRVKAAYSCRIAEIYNESNHIKLGIEFYEQALKYEPKNSLAINTLKVLYLQDKQIDRVALFLEKDDNDNSYFSLAQLNFMYLNNNEKAEQYLLNAISRAPQEKYFAFLTKIYSDNNEAILKIKNTYKRFLNKKELLSFSRYISAVSTKTDYLPITEWIDIFNHNPLTFRFYDIFSVLKKTQEWDILITLLTMRLEITTDVEERLNLNFYLGKVYHFYKKDYSKALKYYSNVIGLDSSHLLASKLREALYKETGNTQGMIDAITNSSKGDKSEELYENSLLLINKFKKYKEAVNLLELAYKNNREDFKIILKLAELYLITDNYKNYISLFNYSKDKLDKEALTKIIEKSIPTIASKESVDNSFLPNFMKISYEYLDDRTWNQMIHNWIDKYDNFELVDKYLKYLLTINKINESILLLNSRIEVTTDKDQLVILYQKLGELKLIHKNEFEALNSYKKAFSLGKSIESLKAIQKIYLENNKYTRNILKEFPPLIKENINYLFLLEGLFYAYKKTNKRRFTYDISLLLHFLNTKDIEIQETYKHNREAYPRNYDIYSKNLSIYLFDKKDSLDFRDMFLLALQGIGKFSKKTTSSYSKLEKITSKDVEWSIFNEVKNNTKMKNLELYIKKDGTDYNIDYIYPDELALVVPEALFKINKNEIKYLLTQAIDRFNSLNFLLKYHSVNEIIDLMKGIINFFLKDEIFKGKNSLAMQKIFGKGVSRSLKKDLSLYEDIGAKVDWKNFDFSSFLDNSYNTSIRIGLVASQGVGFAIKAIIKQNNKSNGFFNYELISQYAQEIPDIDYVTKYSITDQFILLKELLGIKLNEKPL